MNSDKKTAQQRTLEYLESVSGEIQLLALNIAVAAAKLSHSNKIGIEVNQNLSGLVNQATLAVKQMNQLIDAARSEKCPRNPLSDTDNEPVDGKLIRNIETTMNDIIRDSERIVRLLANAR